MTGAAPPDDRLRGVDASPNSADRRPRIVAFNRVSRDRGGFDTGLAVWARLVRNLVPIANVFLFTVVHGLMARKLFADFFVEASFVGHEVAFPADVFPQIGTIT
jgi:hypothetical protein